MTNPYEGADPGIMAEDVEGEDPDDASADGGSEDDGIVEPPSDPYGG